jgi:transposase
VKSPKDAAKILAAYDLTGSARSAATIAGCSHNTVRSHVEALRDTPDPVVVMRPKLIDRFADHIDGWVDRSNGKIRADVVHDKLLRLGYTGSERTTRRAVSEAKKRHQLATTRIHRPWVTEPGLWLQYDFGDGPRIDGVKTVLFVAWLAYSRYRVVIALKDRRQASVFAALDRTFRILGGVPVYVLTDNEKTVTIEHVAGVPVRHPDMVAFSEHYRTEVLTCRPADPQTKGGVEAAVKISKADLVPTEVNLKPDYPHFTALEDACAAFMDKVNIRVHRVTRARPVDRLGVEQEVMRPVPSRPHYASFGQVRKVPENTPMVTFESAQYSVPSLLIGQQVHVCIHGAGNDEQIVIFHHDGDGMTEVARHGRARPGSPSIIDEHFPGDYDIRPGEYTVRATNDDEADFLGIGEHAAIWLVEAAATGTARMRVKMRQAVTLAKLHGTHVVDQALATAADHARFAEGDLESILAHDALITPADTAEAAMSLAQGTSAWSGFGTDGLDSTTPIALVIDDEAPADEAAATRAVEAIITDHGHEDDEQVIS